MAHAFPVQERRNCSAAAKHISARCRSRLPQRIAMNDQNTPSLRSFEQRLQARQFAITAEIAPPVSCDAGDLRRKAEPLKGFADAVNVTDGAGARATMSALAAATILVGMGIEPILQLTCRDKNRIGL